MKYNENFPKLLSSKRNEPEVKVKVQQPPPGLNPALGASQNAFDALLSQRPAAPNSFDALLGRSAGVATSNPFDALLNSSDGVQRSTRTASDDDPSEGTDEPTGGESGSAAKANQKKRKHARAALAKAWMERETIRKRVLGTDTLDGRRALEYATKTYNDLRAELASYMANGELREEDGKMFPWLSPSNLGASNVRPRAIQNLIPEGRVELSAPTIAREQREKIEKRAPKKTDGKIEELMAKAVNARNVYADAHAVFKRPPPQGRTDLKVLKLQADQRIERAAKHYATRRQELAAAYGGALPADVEVELWTYDDGALRRNRALMYL